MGAASALERVVIEHAVTGLLAQGMGLDVQDVILRQNILGLRVTAGAPTIARIRIQDQVGTGALLASAVTLTDALVTRNGQWGLEITGGLVTVDHAEITDNTDQGVVVRATGNARFTASRVTFNGGAGFYVHSLAATNPQLAIEGSNIFGNAAGEGGVGAWVARTANINVSAVDATSGSVPVLSAVNRPGFPIEEVFVRLTVPAGARGWGEVQTEAGAAVSRLSSDGQTRWVPMNRAPAFRVAANRDCCDNVSIQATTLRLVEEGVAGVELSAGIYAANRVTLTNDFWGGEPRFGERLREVTVGSIQLVGFQPAQIPGTGPRQLP